MLSKYVGRQTSSIENDITKTRNEKLAQSQFVLNRKPTYVQEEVYQNLRDLSRFYQNLTEDIVRAKNRLHKVL
ncbi:IS110 family transposase, partial [Streptococcus suis]|nr:IS110 family transposase [Streptococcus suis]